jgi:hypothetical protein
MSTQVRVALIGAVALIAGAIVTGLLTGGGSDPPPPPNNPSPATVTIYARLEQDQYSEGLTIKMDGKTVGDLVIEDRKRPEASMTVSLAPGTHHFEIQSSTYHLAQDGTYREYPVAGEGTIDVLEKDTEQSFEVQGYFTDNTLVVDLARI